MHDATSQRVSVVLESAGSSVPTYECFCLCARLQVMYRMFGFTPEERAKVERARKPLQGGLGLTQRCARPFQLSFESDYLCGFPVKSNPCG